MFGIFGILELTLIILALTFLAVWVWALIDCALHERPDIDKLVWILIILWLNVVGAAIYLIVRRARRGAAASPQPAA